MSHPKKSLLLIILITGVIIGLTVIVLVVKRNRDSPVIETASKVVKRQKSITKTNGEEHTYSHPYLSKADSMNYISLYDSAIYYYKEAAVKFENERNWKGYVWANNYVGHLYISVRKLNHRFSEALPYLNNALKIGQIHLGNPHPFIATSYYYLGLYHYKKNEPTQALQMLNKALAIRLQYFGKENIYVARVYEAIGEVYTYINFDNFTAEKYYDTSLHIKEKLLNKNDPALFNSYYNLIAINELKGDYEKALSYCFQALELAAYSPANKNENMELVQGVMASLYKDTGKLKEARAKLNEVIDMNIANQGDKYNLIYYYNTLGEVNYRLSDYAQAIAAYKKALSTYKIVLNQPGASATDLSYISEEATSTYQGMGLSLLYLNQTEVAEEYLKKCLTMRLKYYGEKHAETATAYQNMGKLYLKSNNLDSALANYQRALMAGIPKFNLANEYVVPSTHLINRTFLYIPTIIAGKAAALKKLYEAHPENAQALQASYLYYCLADTLLTMHRRTYSREMSKLAFTQENHTIYEAAFASALALYQLNHDHTYLEKAFHFMDKRKASLLLETVQEKEALINIGIPEKDYTQEQSLKKDTYYLLSKLEEENTKELPDENTLHTLHARLQANEKKIESIQRKYADTYSYSLENQLNGDTIRLKHLSSFSKKNKAVIMEYFWGDSSIYVIGVYENNYHIIEVKRDILLENSLARYSECLTKGYSIATKTEDFENFQQSAHVIYKRLVEPVEKKLTLATNELNIPAARIVFIPDGPLNFIPFESLITSISGLKKVDYSNLSYLIRKYRISYNYSAHFLVKESKHENLAYECKVLAFSFSKNENLPNKTGNLVSLRNQVSELPGAAKEIAGISTIMQGNYYMGAEATKEKFKAEAPEFDILHLAIHGEADSSSFYNSKLIFRKDTKTHDNEALKMYELLNLKLKAKLTVLSACESGIGRLNRGEGVYSIARGFVVAGCPAVLMSLWKVNDAATADLMIKFYEQLSNAASIDAAARVAKLQYIGQNNTRNAHPAYWAAFVPVGDMGAIQLAKKPNYMWLFVLLIVSFITLIPVLILNRKRSLKKHSAF